MTETTKKFLDAGGLNELVKQIALVSSHLSTKIKKIEEQVNRFITPDDVDDAFQYEGNLPTPTTSTYSLVFKDGGGDNDSNSAIKSTDSVDKIINYTTYCPVSSIIATNNVYLAKKDNGLKFGTQDTRGSLTLEIDSKLKNLVIDKFEIIARAYGDDEGNAEKGAISVNDVEGYLDSTSFKQIVLDLVPDQAASQIYINVSARRAYVKEVIVHYKAPFDSMLDELLGMKR